MDEPCLRRCNRDSLGFVQYARSGSNASTYMTEEPTMRPCLDRFGTIMAIGVSATLDRFLVLGLFIFFSIQDCERTVASSMGQPVTQIFGHGRREGPNCLDGDHHRGDVFLRLRSGPTPYPSAFTFALGSCTLGKDLFCDIYCISS